MPEHPSQIELLELLLRHGAKLAARSLVKAAVSGNLTIIQALTSRHVNWDEPSLHGDTALFSASLAGQQESVKLL